MSFRTRLLLGFVVAVLLPLVILAGGVRAEMTDRLTAQYRQRVAALAGVTRDDLAAENASIAERLAALTAAAADDNRFRSAALQGTATDRSYLLDYAGGAMRLAGLSMLQLQDDAGRIVSSGHFRNEFDRLEPELPRMLSAAPDGMALVRARTPEGPLVALVRADSLRLGGRLFTLVGGVSVEERFLARMTPDRELVVSLVTPDGTLSSSPRADAAPDTVVAEVAIPYIAADAGGAARVLPARLTISHSLGALAAIRRGIDRWFLAAVAISALGALALAAWLSARLSRPLAELASKTSRIDLDRLDVRFESDRDDEIGALSRLLGAMTGRLRASTARLREAERRATVGDVARQVNHDIKNGLTPIRNVLRHLSQVARERPEELPVVFGERQGTLESSVAYLETLAANYARLSPQLARQPCDVNAVARQVARNAGAAAPAELTLRLADDPPPVLGDAVVLRRILENLVGNAIDSLEGRAGTVTLATDAVGTGATVETIRITVSDTGRGMTEQQLSKAFDDFYTTKTAGTGLGLSIVRRLVLDLGGSMRVETGPGTGTRFTIDLPASPSSHHAPRAPHLAFK